MTAGSALSYVQNVVKSRVYGARAALEWAVVEAAELLGAASVLPDMSKGYAAAAHGEPIAGPGTVDLSISVINVFDKKDIDMINASYFAQTSTSTAAFYPGAPRTVIGKVGFRF